MFAVDFLNCFFITNSVAASKLRVQLVKSLLEKHKGNSNIRNTDNLSMVRHEYIKLDTTHIKTDTHYQ